MRCDNSPDSALAPNDAGPVGPRLEINQLAGATFNNELSQKPSADLILLVDYATVGKFSELMILDYDDGRACRFQELLESRSLPIGAGDMRDDAVVADAPENGRIDEIPGLNALHDKAIAALGQRIRKPRHHQSNERRGHEQPAFMDNDHPDGGAARQAQGSRDLMRAILKSSNFSFDSPKGR